MSEANKEGGLKFLEAMDAGAAEATDHCLTRDAVTNTQGPAQARSRTDGA